MSILKVKKGDTVKMLAGKDKGKTGKVIKVDPKKSKIVVEGVNKRKKSVRPKKQGEKGQLVEFNAYFDISNAMIVCPKCGKPSRTGKKKNGDKNTRICKKCKSEF